MRKRTIKIGSSTLAGAGRRVGGIERGAADRIYVDVVDGQFAPNITFGVVKDLRLASRRPLEIHLKIMNRDMFLEEFVVGAALLFVRWEKNNLLRTVHRVRMLGAGAGMAIHPTPSVIIKKILPDEDHVLVMTVKADLSQQYCNTSTFTKTP